MTVSLYDASVPVFIRVLGNLAHIIGKGAAYAEAKKIDPAVLLGSRLFPDMLPLSRQVQIAADFAKGGPSRLAGLEPPKHEDKETTFPELSARIDRTVDYLRTFQREQFDGAEARTVNFKAGGQPTALPGAVYLLTYALPNFYFHVTTAYNILRHNGVELGKRDYLGKY